MNESLLEMQDIREKIKRNVAYQLEDVNINLNFQKIQETFNLAAFLRSWLYCYHLKVRMDIFSHSH